MNILQVLAVDEDDPNAGGMITFTIVSGNENNDKFTIDPKTGVIRTNKVITVTNQLKLLISLWNCNVFY